MVVFGGSSGEQTKFFNFCEDKLNEFTHAQANYVPSLLNLVFLKNLVEINVFDCSAPIGKSDHMVLLFDFHFEGDLKLYSKVSNKYYF